MGGRRKPGTPQSKGRRTRLMEPGVHDRLVEQAKLGVPIILAASAAGIAERTFIDWMQRGSIEHARITEPVPDGTTPPAPDPAEAMYLALYLDVMQARSQAAVRNVGNLQRSAAGGFIVEETTRRYRNSDGEMVEEVTIKKAAPDWRAAAWYLERQHRGHFGKDATQVEITGAGGGPITLTGIAAQADDLAARVAKNLAALAAPPVLEIEGSYVDVETDDDEPAT